MKKNTRNINLKKMKTGGNPNKNKNLPKDIQSIRVARYKGMIY
tara:strand:- start:116 stop:244 length:129 start_codon:yes stop_codon:yes gene_type:complete